MTVEELYALQERLIELRPHLNAGSFGRLYLEAGKLLIELKKEVSSGSFGAACKELGYERRTAQIAMFIARSGVEGEALDKPVNAILDAIRHGERKEEGPGETEFHCDAYWTPQPLISALCDLERFPGRVWEPAAGRGDIANELVRRGYEVAQSDLFTTYGNSASVQGDFFSFPFASWR